MYKFTKCKYGFLVLMFLAIACNTKNNVVQEPETKINKEEMAKILADIHIADAGVNRQYLTSDSSERLIKMYYAIISKKYGYDFNTFSKNYEYYLAMPNQMDSIYNKTIEILNNIEANQRANFLKNQQNNTDTSNITLPVGVIP